MKKIIKDSRVVSAFLPLGIFCREAKEPTRTPD